MTYPDSYGVSTGLLRTQLVLSPRFVPFPREGCEIGVQRGYGCPGIAQTRPQEGVVVPVPPLTSYRPIAAEEEPTTTVGVAPVTVDGSPTEAEGLKTTQRRRPPSTTGGLGSESGKRGSG